MPDVNLILFARFAQSLVEGWTITLPFAPGTRGIDWAETFARGDDPINGGKSIMHTMIMRRNGVDRPQRAEALTWGIDQMVQQMREWDDETRSSVEAQLTQIERCTGIANTIAHIGESGGDGIFTTSGVIWVVRAGMPVRKDGSSTQWSFDDLIETLARQMADERGGAEGSHGTRDLAS